MPIAASILGLLGSLFLILGLAEYLRGSGAANPIRARAWLRVGTIFIVVTLVLLWKHRAA